jgi:hypothetical protein
MSDYYQNLSSESIKHLDAHAEMLARRRMIEGAATFLGDVTISDALQIVSQTDLYTKGEYKDIDTESFAGVFRKIGLDLDKSISENAVFIGNLHLTGTHGSELRSLDFLKFSFKETDKPIDFKTISDAAQLLEHVLHVVSESPSCHQDFADTKLRLSGAEHIRFLTLG